MRGMGDALIDRAIEMLEKGNAELQPELLSAPAARELLAAYAKAEKLAAFGVARWRASSTTPRGSPGSPGPPWARPRQ